MTRNQDLAIFNSWHLPFKIILYSPSQKTEAVESWDNWLLSNWSRLLYWNLAPVFHIVQKVPENYCPHLYLSIGQVWWLNVLWFKRYRYSKMHPVSCTNTYPHTLILIRFGIIMGWLKVQKLEYLENGT